MLQRAVQLHRGLAGPEEALAVGRYGFAFWGDPCPFYHPMPDPGHILVVCTGNICRSPMGAALLQHALAAQPEPLRSLKVVSAGVASRTGRAREPATR